MVQGALHLVCVLLTYTCNILVAVTGEGIISVLFSGTIVVEINCDDVGYARRWSDAFTRSTHECLERKDKRKSHWNSYIGVHLDLYQTSSMWWNGNVGGLYGWGSTSLRISAYNHQCTLTPPAWTMPLYIVKPPRRLWSSGTPSMCAYL